MLMLNCADYSFGWNLLPSLVCRWTPFSLSMSTNSNNATRLSYRIEFENPPMRSSIFKPGPGASVWKAFSLSEHILTIAIVHSHQRQTFFVLFCNQTETKNAKLVVNKQKNGKNTRKRQSIVAKKGQRMSKALLAKNKRNSLQNERITSN